MLTIVSFVRMVLSYPHQLTLERAGRAKRRRRFVRSSAFTRPPEGGTPTPKAVSLPINRDCHGTPNSHSYRRAGNMIREKGDPVSGRFTQKETLVPAIFHRFNWGRRQTQSGKALMRCAQVVDHQIELSITRCPFRLGD